MHDPDAATPLAPGSSSAALPSAPALDAASLVRLRALVDPLRLRVLGRILARPGDAEAIATDLGLTALAVNRALDPLVRAGLAERRPEGSRTVVAARADRVGELARLLAALDGARVRAGGTALTGDWPHEGEPPEDTIAHVAPDPEAARVLRSYFLDGRLTTIPAQAAKREVVLRFLLARVFTEDRPYPEKEVNQRLALFHRDVAALRRYLVDEGLVTRDAAGTSYRRATGDRG